MNPDSRRRVPTGDVEVVPVTQMVTPAQWDALVAWYGRTRLMDIAHRPEEVFPYEKYKVSGTRRCIEALVAKGVLLRDDAGQIRMPSWVRAHMARFVQVSG